MLSKAFWAAKSLHTSLDQALNHRRRAWFLRRLRVHALWARTRLELDVADDVTIGRNIKVTLEPQSQFRLVLRPGAVIEDDVTLFLRAGEMVLQPRAQLRSSCIINVRGRFELGAESIVSWFVVIHCGDSVTIGSRVGVAERATIADSTHFFTDPDAFYYHNTRHSPVAIGNNTWIAAGATIAHGTRVGNNCIVGSGTVASGDVPDGHIIADAKPNVRALRLPWKQTHGALVTETVKTTPGRR